MIKGLCYKSATLWIYECYSSLLVKGLSVVKTVCNEMETTVTLLNINQMTVLLLIQMTVLLLIYVSVLLTLELFIYLFCIILQGFE